MSRETEPLTDDEIVQNVTEARTLLQEICVRTETPALAHAAYQADVHCHALLWELGVEQGTTPELEDLVGEPNA